MKRIRTLVLSFLLACAILVSPFAAYAGFGQTQTFAAENESDNDYSTEYVVLSLEGFTIGQGYYIAPERMSYEEIGKVWKDEGVDIDLSQLTVSQATYAFFKKEGLATEPSGTDGYNSSDFYLANVKGIDKGTANVPQELKDAYEKKNGNALELKTKTGKDLGEFDYFDMSGWMVTVDGVLGNVGAGQYQVDAAGTDSNTHVIRWQFTLADYGADLGYGYNMSTGDFDSAYAYYETYDKTKLYTLYVENRDEIAKNEALDKELQSVMTDLTATADEVKAAENKIRALNGSTVTVTMNNSAPYMTLTDSEGNAVETGDPKGNVYTLYLAPGTYRLSAYQKSGDTKTDMGSIDLVVSDEREQNYTIYSVTGIGCTNYDTVDGARKYWTEGTDFTMTGKVMSADNVDRHAEFVRTKEATSSSYAQYAGIFYNADMVSVTFAPVGARSEGYVAKTISNTLTSNRTYGYSTSLAEARSVEFTVPQGTELRVGTLSTYYIYTDVEGMKIDSTAVGYDTYKYKLGSGITYYYRVTGGEGVTYWNWFSTTENAEYKVTTSDMYIGDDSRNPDTVVHDLSANPLDVADIYMTSNEKGYVSLEKGDTYTLECFRNWQAIEGISNAKSAEPDYHYTVIDENGNPSDDVISVTPGAHSEVAEITAKSEGTAIVLVTYDAEINVPGMSGSFFSAIWPENTGVVVVTVGKDGTGIQTGMTINEGKNPVNYKLAEDRLDAQIDTLYYIEGTDGAEYTFAPEDGTTVAVLRPQIVDDRLTYSGFSTQGVKKNDDGSCTVTGLVTGSNVIKVTKNGVSTYQVVRAKEVAVSYAYKDAEGNEISQDELKAGDTIEVAFGKRSEDGKRAYEGIYMPANKLAGIYNMSGAITLTDDKGNEYKSKVTQYPFASTPAAQTVTVKIPEYYTGDTFRLTGCVLESGFGSEYGSHRGVNHTIGRPAQFAAKTRVGYLGSVPEMTFALASTDFVQVNLKVVDASTGKAVDGYNIEVKDNDGNKAEVTDGSFNGFAGKSYTYAIKSAGYMYKQGEFDIPEDTTSISKTIRLTPSSETAWDGTSMSEPKEADGVYQIGTGAELFWFANEVNVNKKTDIKGALTADVNLAGYNWTPIGTSSDVFAGTFDGQGHTISGLYVKDTAYSGVFGQSKAQINGLTVEGTIELGDKKPAGAIVGYLMQGTADAPAKITNCVSKVNITYTGTNGYAYVGGIAGYAYTGGATNIEITNCVNYGTIKAENGGGAGGIIGGVISGNIFVRNSSNYGELTAKTYVGGIAGYISVSRANAPGCGITECYNAGAVNGESNTGGIAGYFSGNGTASAPAVITGCYSAGEVNADGAVSGTAFAGYTAKVTLTDSVYSCTEAADESITADQAAYVSPADIADVKKLTVDTVSKTADAEKLASVGTVVEKLEKMPLSDADEAFVKLYKELVAAVENSKTVTVAVYDYTAAAAKIKGATADGVVLEPVEVTAATAVDAIKKALDGAGIAYDITDTGYGPYVAGVNGLAPVSEYYMSGWMLSYNNDDFGGDGLSSIKLADGDTLELHYELTGPDVASAFSGLPTFKTLNVGGNEIEFTTETTYDANWNSVYTYKANGEVLTGTGSKDDPFQVDVSLFAGADLVKTDVTYETAADGHYVVVDGLSAVMDLTSAATCSITSKGGRTAWYVINVKADAEKVLTNDNTKIEIADAVYTGEELTPGVTVYVNGNKLGSDNYKVTYSDNVNAGRAKLTVEGAGDFTGSVQTEFEIKKADQEITNVPESQTAVLGETAEIAVEAKAQTAITAVSDNEAVVKVTEDGKLAVTGVGQAKITLIAASSDNYNEASAEFTVTVNGDLSKAECTEIEKQTYTGEAITPDVVLTFGGKELVKDTDYTVSYRNNTAAGTAKIVFTGIGSYKGTKEMTFEIGKSDKTIVAAQTEIEVFEGAEAFDLEVAGHGTLTFVSSDTDVAEVDAETGRVTVKKAGVAEITVSSKGTPNYDAAQAVITITVKKVPVPEVKKIELTKDNTVIKVADVTYTGKAQKPAVTVTVNGKKLTAADYDAVYSSNVNAGTAKVTITGKNSYTGKLEKTFSIKKADQSISGSTVYVYNKYTVINASAKGRITYTSTNARIAVVNKNTGRITARKPGVVKIKVTAAGNSNYNGASGIVTVVVTPAQVTKVKLSAVSGRGIKITYGKVSGATGYRIAYSTDKNFKTYKTKYVSSKYGSAVIKKLAKNKKYYVRIKAYKTVNGRKYYGLGSSTKSITVK